MRGNTTTKQRIKIPWFGRQRIGFAAVLTGTLAAPWITGCSQNSPDASPHSARSQQADSPPPPAPLAASPAPLSPPPKPQAIVGSARSPGFESVMTAWQQGDKATAISHFVQVDWTARPLFAPDSALGLSEAQFETVPASSRPAKQQELIAHVPILKHIGLAVLEAGKDAAAKKDFDTAKKYFASVQQCGDALSGPDFTLLVQQVGKFINKMADEESAKLSQ